jgi:CheY-like chemotaxis protein
MSVPEGVSPSERRSNTRRKDDQRLIDRLTALETEVSGLEVTKSLKDDPELKFIPVIAVTAFAMKGDEERIRQGGCEAYISKPISVPRFIETIKSYLGDA